jgi:hypothetical protein
MRFSNLNKLPTIPATYKIYVTIKPYYDDFYTTSNTCYFSMFQFFMRKKEDNEKGSSTVITFIKTIRLKCYF